MPSVGSSAGDRASEQPSDDDQRTQTAIRSSSRAGERHDDVAAHEFAVIPRIDRYRLRATEKERCARPTATSRAGQSGRRIGEERVDVLHGFQLSRQRRARAIALLEGRVAVGNSCATIENSITGAKSRNFGSSATAAGEGGAPACRAPRAAASGKSPPIEAASLIRLS